MGIRMGMRGKRNGEWNYNWTGCVVLMARGVWFHGPQLQSAVACP